METEFTANDQVAPEEMQSLLESVGGAPYSSIERNATALSGSIFVAAARHKGRLVGLLRLVGDGAYVLHVADMQVHPDFQRKGVGRKLMGMAIDFARKKKTGTGDNSGEFTLFARAGADAFYEKLGFILAPNGMVLTDTGSRRNHELDHQRRWAKQRAKR